MGLAASQARLLLLTARKSDLEYRAQCITNTEMVLAMQTEQVAREYSNKISNTALFFNVGGMGSEGKALTAKDIDSIFDGAYVLYINGQPWHYSESNKLSTSLKPFNGFDYTNDELKKLLNTGIAEIRDPKTGKSLNVFDNPDLPAALYVPAQHREVDSSLNPNFSINTPINDKEVVYDMDDVKKSSNRDVRISSGVMADYLSEIKNGTFDLFVNGEKIRPDLIRDDLSFGVVEGVSSKKVIDGIFIGQKVDWQKIDEGSVSRKNYSALELIEMINNGVAEIRNAKGEVVSLSGNTSFTESYYTDDDAAAEAEYKRKTASIQVKEKRLQMELNQIEAQQKACDTEIDSVKKVMDKNIERTFKVFS